MADGADRTDGHQRLPRPRPEVRADVLPDLPPGLIPMPRAVPVLERIPRAAG